MTNSFTSIHSSRKMQTPSQTSQHVMDRINELYGIPMYSQKILFMYLYYLPRCVHTYRPNKPLAPKMATFRPASEPRPPGPISFSLRSVILGTTGVFVARFLVRVLAMKDVATLCALVFVVASSMMIIVFLE